AYTVKPGTQSGTRIRLRGKGVPTLRNKNVRGNHYVDVIVDVPTSLNKEQKALLEEFEETLNGGKKKGKKNK
ncbi:MAG: molecular chaperone DnaJ, partial [Eubacterium sp.]|nr:molecular chaperone DnaJ [Eubacterium sp.]